MPVLRFGRRRADSHGATGDGGNDDGLTLDAARRRSSRALMATGTSAGRPQRRRPRASSCPPRPRPLRRLAKCDSAGAAADGTPAPRAAPPPYPVGHPVVQRVWARARLALPTPGSSPRRDGAVAPRRPPSRPPRRGGGGSDGGAVADPTTPAAARRAAPWRPQRRGGKGTPPG
ncbi:hypothetical protein BU14_0501s0012 [Porphyra umbilicalis]|uniref:Uncharacterized protein n=1 Tax=Porphyra umbilicalis TaxID=2786 RepID=A0A1X6NT54_PORUM|nr:hypothetical protein BU14_0501s0012 [Porphyra umbilicalis]|eukprot:OSX71792.1 hypothetical protein BU14_0501s0012 [Porphyra umbilicalis]